MYNAGLKCHPSLNFSVCICFYWEFNGESDFYRIDKSHFLG